MIHLAQKLFTVFAGNYRYLLLIAAFVAVRLALAAVDEASKGPGVRKAVATAAVSLSLFVVSINIVAAALYVFAPQYIDHIEPHVIITSMNWLAGLPLHPIWERGEGAYGMLYGPFLYEVVAVFLSISKDMWALKFAMVALYLLSLLIMCVSAWRVRSSSCKYWLLYYILIVIAAGPLVFWVRAEPVLLVLVALATLGAALAPITAQAFVVGVCAGLAAAVKIHGFLYFAPLGALLAFASLGSPGRIARVVVTGGIAFVLAAAAPFLISGEGFAAFIRYNEVISGHGLRPRMIALNGLGGLAILAPVWAAVRGASPTQRRLLLIPLLVTTAAVFVVVLIGAKPGSGPHHLIPFVPVLLLILLQAGPSDAADKYQPAALVAALAAAILPTTMLIITVASLLWNATTLRAQRLEAAELAASYPSAEFAPGADPYSPALMSRVEAANRGARLRFDAAAWSDLAFAGVSETHSLIIEGCKTPFWIAPKGEEPFSTFNPKDGLPLFTSELRTTFRTHHEVVRSGRFYDAWKCHTATSAPHG